MTRKPPDSELAKLLKPSKHTMTLRTKLWLAGWPTAAFGFALVLKTFPSWWTLFWLSLGVALVRALIATRPLNRFLLILPREWVRRDLHNHTKTIAGEPPKGASGSPVGVSLGRTTTRWKP